MLKHNLKLFFRNIGKNKSTFLINIIGLSTGLACVLLIALWVKDELAMDKFHKNDDRLYQVMRNHPVGNEIVTNEGNPALLAQALAEEMPEVEYATTVVPPFWYTGQGIIEYNDKQLKADAQFVGEAYFEMFSWKLLQGNKEDVLSDKYGVVVISDELANRLFPNSETIIGKDIQWEYEDYSGAYHIAGVFEKLPENTTENFDILFSYALYFQINLERSNLADWGNSTPRAYLTLKPGTDVEAFNKKIENFIGTKHKESKSTLFLRHYSDKYLHGRYENGKSVGGRIDYVYLFTGVALFILLIACINFVNLSVARASRGRGGGGGWGGGG
ncbi:MAG: ABC transporter permease, partial [Bacteroidota bacterium]